MSKKRRLTSSFGYALEGVVEAFKNEPNFKIHLVIGVLATILGVYLKISSTEWTIVTLTIGGVLTLELINTAIEAIVDIVSPKFSKLAKVAKDVSAAAVLISAIAASIVGFIIFLPKILSQ